MIELVEGFHEAFISTVKNAERLCFATRAKELQLDAIEQLDSRIREATQLKAMVVEARIEELANRMLSYEEVLRAQTFELRMWVALKEEEPDAAWDALVEAQSSARRALVAHDISSHLWGYIKRLKMLEAMLFPPIQFLSVGALVRHSTCSICEEEYGKCDHLKGKVYMGQFCARVIHEANLIETSLVDEPTNRHCRILGFTENGITRDALSWRIRGADGESSRIKAQAASV